MSRKIFLIIFLAVISSMGFLMLRLSVLDKVTFDQGLIVGYISSAFIFAIIFCVFMLFIKAFYNHILRDTRLFAALVCVIVVSFAVGFLIEKIHIYAIPITLTALLVGVLIDARLGFVANIFTVLMIFTAIALKGAEENITINSEMIYLLLVAAICGTLTAYFASKRSDRLYVIVSTLLVNLISIPIVFLLKLNTLSNFVDQLPSVSIMIFGTLFLFLVLQPVIEKVFNVLTNTRLIELTDPNQPLIKRLSEEAPGTYNHALTVANLAETCAAQIGENIYMARAAAYYHDIGKLKNPMYFTENQATESNPHDELTPEASTDIIRKHATYGFQLCKENKIPPEIAKITLEHHGKMPIAYFYSKAKELSDGKELDISEYCYAGPTPSTKIAALIMICDSAEAAVRSLDKPVPEIVDKVVKSIIEARRNSGEFDDCGLTMRDMYTIRGVIVNAFCGLYHQRIKYPDSKKA